MKRQATKLIFKRPETRASWLVKILAIAAALLLPVGMATADEPTVQQLLRWLPVQGTEATGQAQVLQITERRSGELVSRRLVETPAGHRVISVRSTRGFAGTFVRQLIDDETGWWIEMEIDFGFATENLKEFLNRVEDRINEPGATLRVTVRTSESLHHEAEVPVAGQIHLAAEALGKELAGTPTGRALAESIPPGLVPTLAFLDQHTEQTYVEGVTTLTRFLAALEPAISDPATSPGRWRFEPEEPRKSFTVSDPELRSFAGKFSAIDPDRPMESIR